jgi:putative aminopeptidase FrvX
VLAESPIEYFEGMAIESSEDDRRSVGALLALLRRVVARSPNVELYPVWNGEESLAPKGYL